MSDPAIRIEYVTVGDVEAFARRSLEAEASGEMAPISLRRAASQARNPHAAAEDVALVLAYDGGRLVGYHGLLPGLAAAGGARFKVSWLVTFYVAPDCRSRGIGRALVEAIRALDIDLATTGITDGAARTYRACGFRDLGELSYRQLQAERLPRWVRPAFFTALRWSRPRPPARWTFRPAERVDPQWPRLGPGPANRARFHRGSETVNWMLAHPWVVSRRQAKADARRYHFSLERELFEYHCLEATHREKGPGGCFLISASRGRRRAHVKVLDLFFEDPALAAWACDGALAQAARIGAERVDLPAGGICRRSAPAWAGRFLKSRRRLYLYLPKGPDSPLAAAAAGIALDYCDSDTAFT
jgi:GNAT superfamily N-acetyltransferase